MIVLVITSNSFFCVKASEFHQDLFGLIIFVSLPFCYRKYKQEFLNEIAIRSENLTCAQGKKGLWRQKQKINDFGILYMFLNLV